MFAAHTTKFRIVADQIREFTALLHEVAVRKARNAILKSRHTEQFAQDQSRVIETQSLIEVGGQKVVFELRISHVQVLPAIPDRAAAYHNLSAKDRCQATKIRLNANSFHACSPGTVTQARAAAAARAAGLKVLYPSCWY